MQHATSIQHYGFILLQHMNYLATVTFGYLIQCSLLSVADIIHVCMLNFMLQFYKCGLPYALVSLSCIGVYAAYTFSITSWRTKFRMQMNAADQEMGNRAIDSLINYETVKVFKI
jgi:ATP-binding cassette subfamily B (MDR/TAP) protein 7